jgi:hypothetical protein
MAGRAEDLKLAERLLLHLVLKLPRDSSIGDVGPPSELGPLPGKKAPPGMKADLRRPILRRAQSVSYPRESIPDWDGFEVQASVLKDPGRFLRRAC